MPVVKIVEVPVDKVIMRDKVVEVPHNIDVTVQRYFSRDHVSRVDR